jgi:uncharacterized protein (TIGR03437 family)
VLYLTGAGTYNLRIGDGDLGPMAPPFPVTALGVGAAIWSGNGSLSWPGRSVPVLFAGQAPGLVAGVVQLNVRIPTDAKGRVGIIAYVGDYPTGSFEDYIEVQ